MGGLWDNGFPNCSLTRRRDIEQEVTKHEARSPSPVSPSLVFSSDVQRDRRSWAPYSVICRSRNPTTWAPGRWECVRLVYWSIIGLVSSTATLRRELRCWAIALPQVQYGARSIGTWSVRTHCIQPITTHTEISKRSDWLMSTDPVPILMAPYCIMREGADDHGYFKYSNGAAAPLQPQCCHWRAWLVKVADDPSIGPGFGQGANGSNPRHDVGRPLFIPVAIAPKKPTQDCGAFNRLLKHEVGQSSVGPESLP
jgi:hypothetical protein